SQCVRHFLINSLKIDKLKVNTEKGFKFYGGDWKLEDTFEEIAKKGEGIARLGVLRLDVDNLGQIFKDGFRKHATFGRVVQLSTMLDFFFSHYLNRLKYLWWDPVEGIIEEKDTQSKRYEVKNLVEIVYSGGDDVFIVGHWSLLPDIALWINDNFIKFTGENKNFSISAGIALFDDKYPLYKAANEAGELESIAKKKERKNKIKKDSDDNKKDGICFLDENTPVSWNDFKEIRKWVREFYKLIVDGIDNRKLSRGFISRLYSIYYEYEQEKYESWSRWRWRAAYFLTRLACQYGEKIGDKIMKFAAELFTGSNTEQELINLLYIIAQWIDLLTRKEEK
ncbi:MAG: hypothetical protein N2053_13095, partial [Chitinispirillaceae bacterium]|nr:hypothetical protein [Chitinispirillaceae bacterium]